MRPLTIALLAAAATIAFVACGDDDEADVTPTPVATQPAEPTASPSPSPEPFNGGRDPLTREDPAVPPVALLTAVETVAGDTFDSVTFTFTDNMPGYRIEYVQPPIVADGSGNPVTIAGSAFLQVRFTASQAHDEAGNPTMAVREFTPGLASVTELEQTGDFEGYVTWVLGLPEALDFRVTDLAGGVLVEIAHP